MIQLTLAEIPSQVLELLRPSVDPARLQGAH